MKMLLRTRCAIFGACCLFSVPAGALEIKLDESWLPKLAQLCDAARYAARMTAEPICSDLGAVVQKAQADEAAAKGKDKEPPKDQK